MRVAARHSSSSASEFGCDRLVHPRNYDLDGVPLPFGCGPAWPRGSNGTRTHAKGLGAGETHPVAGPLPRGRQARHRETDDGVLNARGSYRGLLAAALCDDPMGFRLSASKAATSPAPRPPIRPNSLTDHPRLARAGPQNASTRLDPSPTRPPGAPTGDSRAASAATARPTDSPPQRTPRPHKGPQGVSFGPARGGSVFNGELLSNVVDEMA